MTVADTDGANHRKLDDLKGNNTVCYRIGASTTAAKSADIQIEKSVGQTKVNAGEPQVFTLTVTNNGPWPATSIRLKDRLTWINVVSDVRENMVLPAGCAAKIANSVSTALNVTCTISILTKDTSQDIVLNIKNVGGDNLKANDNVDARTNSATAYSLDVPHKSHEAVGATCIAPTSTTTPTLIRTYA